MAIKISLILPAIKWWFSIVFGITRPDMAEINMLQSLTWYNYRDSLRFGISMDKHSPCGENPSIFQKVHPKTSSSTKNHWWFGTWTAFMTFHWEFHHPNWLSLHHFSEALKHHQIIIFPFVDCVERPYVPYITWVWFHLAKWRKKSAQNLPISEVIVNRHDFW